MVTVEYNSNGGYNSSYNEGFSSALHAAIDSQLKKIMGCSKQNTEEEGWTGGIAESRPQAQISEGDGGQGSWGLLPCVESKVER